MLAWFWKSALSFSASLSSKTKKNRLETNMRVIPVFLELGLRMRKRYKMDLTQLFRVSVEISRDIKCSVTMLISKAEKWVLVFLVWFIFRFDFSWKKEMKWMWNGWFKGFGNLLNLFFMSETFWFFLDSLSAKISLYVNLTVGNDTVHHLFPISG